ncbi:unnamed protein product [Symbiodinium sp. CCMP2592]|nr:unnamed protein product [Symbiodinium sp. CCMP2592]
MPEPDTTPMPPVPEPSTAPMIVEAQEEETDEDECWGKWRPTSSTTALLLARVRPQPAASQRKEAGSVVPSTWGTAACDSTEGPRLNSYGAKYAPKGASHTTEVSDYTTKGANHTAKESAKESAKGRASAAQHLDSTTSTEGRSEGCRSKGSAKQRFQSRRRVRRQRFQSRRRARLQQRRLL